MRKQIALSFLIICLVMICGCFNTEKPQRLFFIGEEYEFGRRKVLVTDDSENERLVIKYDLQENFPDDENMYFEFTFIHHDCERVDKSQFYFYDDELNEVVFNEENNSFYFNQDKIIYVSYKNSNIDVKNSIKLKDFSVAIGVGTFLHNNFGNN